MARRKKPEPAKKQPSELRLRVAKHMKALGHRSVPAYLAWCRSHGFDPSTEKNADQVAIEARAHAGDIERARQRTRAARDPRKLIELVSSGALRAQEVAAAEWRRVCDRIEASDTGEEARRSLHQLLLNVVGQADFVHGTVVFGDASFAYIDGLLELNRYRSHWIRPVDSWTARSHNRRKQFSSLARHLLARYPVPAFMDSVWFRRDAGSDGLRDWFLRIASGRSIRTAGTPIPLTRRMAHLFLEAPDGYSIEQALRWGQVHGLGGDSRLTEALIATRLGRSFEHEDFWVTVIRFFIRNPLLDRRHVGPIVDYLQHQRFESPMVFVAPGVREQQQPPQPHLSMHGRSVEALLRQVERWHSELGRRPAASHLQWESSGTGGMEIQTGTKGKNLKVWRIRELLTAAELQREGRAMRHCVATYAGSCAAGRCSIWTLEVESYDGIEKRQTIEVNRHKVIVESRGKFNALPTQQDMEMLNRWATEQVLQVSARLLGR